MALSQLLQPSLQTNFYRAADCLFQLHSSLGLHCHAGRRSLRLVIEKRPFVWDQQCVISAGAPSQPKSSRGGGCRRAFLRAFQQLYSKSSDNLSKQRRWRRREEKTQETDEYETSITRARPWEAPGPGVNFTPNDCRLVMTSPAGERREERQGYPASISSGSGGVVVVVVVARGEEDLEEGREEMEVRSKGAMNERWP